MSPLEGGPSFEPSPELSELSRHPEQVFDSDLNSADREFNQLMQRLTRRGEIYRSGERASFHALETTPGSLPAIQIAWPEPNGNCMVLRLSPHVENKGPESVALAYSGEYGLGKRRGDKYEYKLIPLSELYGIPKDLNIVVKPTATRWAIGKDDMAVAYGENTRTLYMGLGFLLLGQEYMHIGMHESGHLPNNPDENIAWEWANKYYASLNRPNRDKIVEGHSQGIFHLLKKVDPYGRVPTIGKIVQYGLVSHSLAKNADIPVQWQQKSEQIMREFDGVIDRADEAYEYFIGR